MKTTINKLPNSEVAIDVVIPEDVFESYRAKALKNVAEHVEIDGFRKGKAPAHLVEKQVNQMALMEEMASAAIEDAYPKIIVDNKIDAIGRPAIAIKKMGKGSTLEFTATVAVMPVFELPDYKKIAAKANKDVKETTVTDEELSEAIKELKRAREHQEMHDRKVEHNEEDIKKQLYDDTLTDEYVKQLGDFENVDAFKKRFKENIYNEKAGREREKNRVATLEAILAETKIEVPEVLVQNELENLIGRMKADIANAGIPFDEYIKHIQKTEEDIRKDLRPDAEKRAKIELIMHKIGLAEKLEPKKEDVETEVKRLIQTYQDADPERAQAFVLHLLTNEEIFKLFEAQK